MTGADQEPTGELEPYPTPPAPVSALPHVIASAHQRDHGQRRRLTVVLLWVVLLAAGVALVALESWLLFSALLPPY